MFNCCATTIDFFEQKMEKADKRFAVAVSDTTMLRKVQMPIQ
jgi:hypothetical protein